MPALACASRSAEETPCSRYEEKGLCETATNTAPGYAAGANHCLYCRERPEESGADRLVCFANVPSKVFNSRSLLNTSSGQVLTTAIRPFGSTRKIVGQA